MTRQLSAVIVACLLVTSVSVAQDDIVSTPTNEVLRAFPGDQIYVEGTPHQEEVIRMSDSIESKMPGSMRLPFKFAIDKTELRQSGSRGEWRYFAAPQVKARAWHGLLGSVIAPGDTVGVRINLRTGIKEWFVDNSRYNGFNTIWHRKVKPEEEALISIVKINSLDSEDRMRALQYLGVRDGQLRVRYREGGQTTVTEEFYFPIEETSPMTIGVMGLRAEVSEISGTTATFRILRGFNPGSFADFAPPSE